MGVQTDQRVGISLIEAIAKCARGSPDFRCELPNVRALDRLPRPLP